MPSLSQLFGVKRGSNSSSNRQEFFPVSRNLQSALLAGDRLHSRSRRNIVVCHSGSSCRRTLSKEISRRFSPVTYDGCNSRWNLNRKIYLAPNPEKELNALNVAIINVRKLLKKKHQRLLAVHQSQTSPLYTCNCTDDHVEQRADRSEALDEDDVHDKHSGLLKNLLQEADHQQKAVNILLERGRCYLQHNPCTTLELDLDSLTFLWNSFTRKLSQLLNTSLQHLLIPASDEDKENYIPQSVLNKSREELKSTSIKLPKSANSSCSQHSAHPPEGNSTLNFVSGYKSLNLPFHKANSKCAALEQSSKTSQEENLLENQPSDVKISFSENKIASSEKRVGPDSEIKSEELVFESSLKVQKESLPSLGGVIEQKISRLGSNAVELHLKSCEKKTLSPLSERTRLVAATLWPASGNRGWLKIAGQGFFTKTSHWQHRRDIVFSSISSEQPPKLCSPDSFQESEQSLQSKVLTAECLDLATVQTCSLPVQETGFYQAIWSQKSKHGRKHHNEQQRTPAQQTKGNSERRNCSDGEEQAILQLHEALTASEKKHKMEFEDALKEMNGSSMDSSPGGSLVDLNGSNSASSNALHDLDLDDLDLPTGPKRRRMNTDLPSLVSSCSDSPLISGDSSLNGTPTSSPAGTLCRDFKQRYKKDELWKAIESNYKYLMDKEIIETCQSTETDLSGKDEASSSIVSFEEFLGKYQELIDWLNQALRNTQRTVNSLSEKYLNQTYHEEMQEKTSCREFLNKSAHQLLLHHPSLHDQINLRMQHLNRQWQVVEAAVTPQHSNINADSVLQDLECDLTALRRWLNATESRLLPLTIRADWTDTELGDRLKQHQLLQQDIESHSRIVSAVRKLSERLEQGTSSTSNTHCDSLQLVALNLERRWHGIWLQSLEWQCRLEEAINRRKGLYGAGFNFNSFSLPTLDESCFSDGSDLDLKANDSFTTGSNGSLIELSDDSLLFIGTRTEHRVAETPSPVEPISPSDSFIQPAQNLFDLASPKLISFLDRSSGDSANISESESKMGDSLRGGSLSQDCLSLSLNMSSDGEGESSSLVSKDPHEPKDIGYSSESQSNDETESMQQQIAFECRFPGIIEVASDSPLGEKMTIPPGGVRQDYYCMTIVDLDSTDKTTTDDGDTTDDKENHGMNMLENRKDAVRVQDSGLNIRMDSSSQTVLVSNRDAATGSQEDIAVKSWLESSEEVDQLEVENSILTAVDVNSLLQGSLSESDSATESKEKIRYLIDHAEDLVKTSPRSTAQGSPKRKPSPSKQTQTVIIESSSIESSCDASSENSEESGTEEFSTATDDADETLFDSVINLNSTMDSQMSREDMSTLLSLCPAADSTRLRKQTGPRGSKKDRPWSVVGFQDLRNIDFEPLSTSESAIDRIHLHTDTDWFSSPFLLPNHASTFPRNARSRVYQRAVSACEQQTSPRAAKRKLKYSSSSGATESLASQSVVGRAASTVEQENEQTCVYNSMEQLRCQVQPVHCVETGCETTDEYVTASMDEMMTSADEDPHNSTGSFSENAWDNYQMMYPTASEDAAEEMLQWEPVDDLEFDDDFSFIVPKGPSLLSDAISKRAKKQKLKAIPSDDVCEDSDSDMEDFCSVLEDSEMCLKKVESSLIKKRSNPMGTGLASARKYAEILATCDTNINCVKEICQHLTQEDIGINHVQRVQDLLQQWEELYTLTTDRQQQAQQLSVVSRFIATVKASIEEAQQCLSFEIFSSKQELEATITTLQLKRKMLDTQRLSLKEHERDIRTFMQQQPAIKISKYLDELQTLDQHALKTQSKVNSHLQGLQNNWAVWCEYLEDQQELDKLMTADRDRLHALLCQREAGRLVTAKDVLKELETLQNNLTVYESKLLVLQAMHQHLTKVSDDQVQRSFLASLADLRNQLHIVSQRCRQMHQDMAYENFAILQMDQSELGRLAVSAANLQESDKAKQNLLRLSHYDAEAAVEDGSSHQTVHHGRALSWLRSVPVQIVALMMVAGLVYILDPDLLSDLANFSLTVSPELKYVNGLPPV